MQTEFNDLIKVFSNRTIDVVDFDMQNRKVEIFFEFDNKITSLLLFDCLKAFVLGNIEKKIKCISVQKCGTAFYTYLKESEINHEGFYELFIQMEEEPKAEARFLFKTLEVL